MLKRVSVIGVGLIGGSFALALKRAKAVDQVTGFGRAGKDLRAALDLKVIDLAATSIADAVRGADLILIATPVRQIHGLLAQIAPHLDADTVVTDAGSTKQDVVSAAREALGARAAQFVPGHPIAGAERSGVDAAQADLFDGRNVVLTPLEENAPHAVERVRAAWTACGANVVEMRDAAHDAVFAAVSHLPHILAYALVDDISTRDNAAELFSFAAGGFRDFTRIASSSPEMWRDIALNNRDALLAEIDAYHARLAEFRKLIDASNGDALERIMADARAARDAWLEQFNAARAIE